MNPAAYHSIDNPHQTLARHINALLSQTQRCSAPLFGLALLCLLAVSPQSLIASVTVVTKSNNTTGFADNSSLSRTINFSAADFGPNTTIDDLNISVSFAKSNNNSFVAENASITRGRPYYNEISFVLTSPDNNSVTLISNTGANSFNRGNNSGFQGTITFDQSAATAVNANRNRINSGTFQPASPLLNSLDIFNGGEALGDWTLQIADDVGQDGLSFYNYSVTITTITVVPEPQNVSLWGTFFIAAIVIGFHRPRRKREEHLMLNLS